MAPGGPENADFKDFRASATEWRQEDPRMLILNIFLPRKPNGHGAQEISCARIIINHQLLVYYPPSNKVKLKIKQCFKILT